MSKYGAWAKESDGVWRHPRYPKGGPRQHPEIEIRYEDDFNGATLTVGDTLVALTHGNLRSLIDQCIQVNKQIQAENSVLWAEKVAIIEVEERTA